MLPDVEADIMAMDVSADNTAGTDSESDDDNDHNNIKDCTSNEGADILIDNGVAAHSDVPISCSYSVLDDAIIHSQLAPKHDQCDYFAKAKAIQTGSRRQSPPRVFVSGQTALHLNVHPSVAKKNIDDIACLFH